ncbi:hypothetical protein [Zobellella sp. DQSA1]|uniref:hypothetical protein n=1 Tax=Zobellella sp. DQSA1 TaxID=3342386 RepID=UPI0035BF7020
MATELIAGVLAGGSYRRHMHEVRLRLVPARKKAIERLAPLGLVPWVIPRGGCSLWCRLPDGHDSAAIAQRCMKEKIVLAPGNVFSVSRSAIPFLRFNVALLDDMRIFAMLEKALKEAGQG